MSPAQLTARERPGLGLTESGPDRHWWNGKTRSPWREVKIPVARGVAQALDANHVSEPGDLQEIGTCRACGMLISRNEQGTWSHGASVGEIDAAEVWLNRH